MNYLSKTKAEYLVKDPNLNIHFKNNKWCTLLAYTTSFWLSKMSKSPNPSIKNYANLKKLDAKI